MAPFGITDGADVVNGLHAVAQQQAAGFARHVALAMRADRMSLLVIEGVNVHPASARSIPDEG